MLTGRQGYEWNKYNRTHYDADNPPPKVVQGYKFNIFYPDLLDKSKIPQYSVVRPPFASPQHTRRPGQAARGARLCTAQVPCRPAVRGV